VEARRDTSAAAPDELDKGPLGARERGGETEGARRRRVQRRPRAPTTTRTLRPAADEIKQALGLEPHPTCGFVRESYRSEERVPVSALPGFDGDRARASVLYFMVTPDARMALHRIKPDQMYHHYLGDPLEVLLLYANGTGAIETVGLDLAAGVRPQLLIPGGTWHVSRLRRDGELALLATTEWPGVEPSDVEAADPERLVEAYPGFAAEVGEFAGADAHEARTLRHP
jgi:uncharacterized protein